MNYFLLLITLFSVQSFAYESFRSPSNATIKNSGKRWTYMSEEDCKRSDSQIVLNVGIEDISPRIVYVRENDKVCMIVNSEDIRVSLSIEKYPVSITVQKNKSEMIYFKANQVGEFKLICRGCADGRNFTGAKLVVEKGVDFDKKQEEYLREEAESYRTRSYKRRTQERIPRSYNGN